MEYRVVHFEEIERRWCPTWIDGLPIKDYSTAAWVFKDKIVQWPGSHWRLIDEKGRIYDEYEPRHHVGFQWKEEGF